jgi:TetR/AcrR family transcriptional regulator, transcriptional repressor for nem operon
MRYKAGYKDEKRQALLKSAGGRVKTQGFAATGIDDLMKAANVTSGTFYSHFSSKTDFLHALIVKELQRSNKMWAADAEADADEWVRDLAGKYLSPQHVANPQSGCLLPALSAEIARADLPAREIFQDGLEQGHGQIAKMLGDDGRAWAFLSQIVGAILLARAVPDGERQGEILQASRAMVEEVFAKAR